MQKLEIVLSGPDEDICAKLINNLANTTMRYYEVHAISSYCGPAPLKAGHGELLVPEFMQRRIGKSEKKKKKAR